MLKPHQKKQSHVKANLEVTSSQFSLIHFKVCPPKAKNKNKKAKTKGMTASAALLSFTPEKHCQKLHKHTHTNTSTKTTFGFQASPPQVCLPRMPGGRVALSTCLILASSRRDQQSKTLLRYPTIPLRGFFSPGGPTATACH